MYILKPSRADGNSSDGTLRPEPLYKSIVRRWPEYSVVEFTVTTGYRVQKSATRIIISSTIMDSGNGYHNAALLQEQGRNKFLISSLS